jgi:hypothetical protein
MKIGEVKLKLSNAVLNLIDTYFNGKDMSERFINSTLKIILKQNLYRADSVLSLFADKDGNINTDEIVEEYSKMIGESGYIFDIKEYISNETVRNMIPDKVLVIKQEDILNLFKK